MFGSSSDQSSAQSESVLNFNSSGWVVGKGNASGGGLSASQSTGLPWYAWATLAAVGASYFYYKKKRGK